MVLYPNKLPESERVCSGICTQTDVMSHPVVNHSAKGIDPLAHVRLSGTQEIAHGIIQTEHGRIICVSIQMSVQGFHGCQGGS